MFEQYHNDSEYCRQRLLNTFLRLKGKEELIYITGVEVVRRKVRLSTGSQNYSLDDVVLTFPSLGYTAPLLFSRDWTGMPLALYRGRGEWTQLEPSLTGGEVPRPYLESLYIQVYPLRQFKQGLHHSLLGVSRMDERADFSMSHLSNTKILESAVFKQYPKDMPTEFHGVPLLSTCVPLCRDVLLSSRGTYIRGKPAKRETQATEAFLRARFAKIVWSQYDENVRAILATAS